MRVEARIAETAKQAQDALLEQDKGAQANLSAIIANAKSAEKDLVEYEKGNRRFCQQYHTHSRTEEKIQQWPRLPSIPMRTEFTLH